MSGDSWANSQLHGSGTVQSKQSARDRISTDTEAFLNAGNQIDKIDGFETTSVYAGMTKEEIIVIKGRDAGLSIDDIAKKAKATKQLVKYILKEVERRGL